MPYSQKFEFMDVLIERAINDVRPYDPEHAGLPMVYTTPLSRIFSDTLPP
jgi:hypothetical protein